MISLRLKVLAQVAVSAACLAVILRHVQFSRLRACASQVDLLPVAIVFAIMPFAVAVRALRWRFLLAAKGWRFRSPWRTG